MNKYDGKILKVEITPIHISEGPTGHPYGHVDTVWKVVAEDGTEIGRASELDKHGIPVSEVFSGQLKLTDYKEFYKK